MKEEELKKFLQSQKAMAIASCDDNEPWVANIFVGMDDEFNIYFVSSESTKHSQQIMKNNKVAFSTIWFNEDDHTDRKGVQGVGFCEIVSSDKEIAKGVELHNQKYPEFKERITVDWIHNNEYQSRVWKIRPKFIKFWNDELYRDDEVEEFDF